jgi:GntR family transcriptional regulator
MTYYGAKKPLYIQLKEKLIEQIEVGKLSAGDAIPGERALAEMYNVSRVTVRKCIEILADDGFVTRGNGKETIVANRKISLRLGDLLGIREELLEISEDVKVVELFKGHETLPNEVSRHLCLENSDLVYTFVRLFLVKNKPMLINYSYIAPDKSNLIEVMDLNKAVIFTHLENCGYKISFAEQEINAELCTINEEKYLDYAVGLPVMVRKRTTYLEGGYPILYDKCIYRGDLYEYSIKLWRKTKV